MRKTTCTVLLAVILAALAGSAEAQTAHPQPEGREGVTRPPATPAQPTGKEGGSNSSAPT